MKALINWFLRLCQSKEEKNEEQQTKQEIETKIEPKSVDLTTAKFVVESVSKRKKHKKRKRSKSKEKKVKAKEEKKEEHSENTPSPKYHRPLKFQSLSVDTTGNSILSRKSIESSITKSQISTVVLSPGYTS
ncbi:unnamed protein product [Blepharisma stoltei]|uniref:Uncharacterized protein n=1 Tax=Blepharisma stoltei TaxID=1481888 RepID=A0AAU9IWT9_9CILI|nr:unnamed protein product [Blepharisma stoltei]